MGGRKSDIGEGVGDSSPFFLFCGISVKKAVRKTSEVAEVMKALEEKILKEGLPNMEFDMKDNKVHGNAGCNIFNSTVVLDDQDISSITINPAATTMMACPDMETEDAILKAMGNVKGVKAGQSENEMLLVDADGNVLMVLSKN